jgi:hypothetical protein
MFVRVIQYGAVIAYTLDRRRVLKFDVFSQVLD